jgi:hypothetical protein
MDLGVLAYIDILTLFFQSLVFIILEQLIYNGHQFFT